MNITLAQSQTPYKKSVTNTGLTRDWIRMLSMLVTMTTFELFNYAITLVAIHSLLWNTKMSGMNWTFMLSITICCMDAAGIFYLFLSKGTISHYKQPNCIFGAWLLLTGLNAGLTWQGLIQTIITHQNQIGQVMDINLIGKILPSFIAILVWVIRIMIIGWLSQTNHPHAGTRDFTSSSVFPSNQTDGQDKVSFSTLPHESEFLMNQLFQPPGQNKINHNPKYGRSSVRYRAF